MKLFIALLLSAALAAPPKETLPAVTVTLAAAGDNLIHSTIYKNARTQNGYDFSSVYTEVQGIISSADVAYINQETPLGTENFSGYPKFCSPKQVADALAGAGFDVIGVCNNHMLDRGDTGLAKTRDHLLATAEAVCGYDGESIAVIERKGIKLAFVGFTYSTNCDGYSDVPRLSEGLVRRLVAKAEEIADVTVCTVHWGDEYDSGRYLEKFQITEKQRYYSDLMAECGAELILGTHPHVLQEIEWIEKDGRKTLCVYSLGNFLSNMRYGAQMLGGIFTVSITKRGNSIELEAPKLIPTVCHFNQMHRGYKIYPLAEYTDALASVHGTNDEANEKRFCLENIIINYENNIGAEFRPENYRKGIEKNDQP